MIVLHGSGISVFLLAILLVEKNQQVLVAETRSTDESNCVNLIVSTKGALKFAKILQHASLEGTKSSVIFIDSIQSKSPQHYALNAAPAFSHFVMYNPLIFERYLRKFLTSSGVNIINVRQIKYFNQNIQGLIHFHVKCQNLNHINVSNLQWNGLSDRYLPTQAVILRNLKLQFPTIRENVSNYEILMEGFGSDITNISQVSVYIDKLLFDYQSFNRCSRL